MPSRQDTDTIYWRVNPAYPIELAYWDDDQYVVVFHPVSGDLHLVTKIGARILEMLQEGPRSRIEIEHQLLPDGGASASNASGMDFDRIYLRPLFKLGLIELSRK